MKTTTLNYLSPGRVANNKTRNAGKELKRREATSTLGEKAN